MSVEFSLRQRFFSIITLGDKPFETMTGPPQFSNLHSPLRPANCVTVTNGVLGLSSHIGIHGNKGSHYWFNQLRIVDFEVGGIQLNGCSDVHITDVQVGPSLGAAGSSGVTRAMATLSQAILLLRIADVALHADERFEELLAEESQETAFDVLREDVESFIEAAASGSPAEHATFNPPSFENVPDGGAIYGILFHKVGPAIQDFTTCCAAGEEGTEEFSTFRLSNVQISDLRLQSDEVITTNVDARAVLGPAGDVVQLWRLTDEEGRYAGNPLSDAQALFMHLRNQFTAPAPTADDDSSDSRDSSEDLDTTTSTSTATSTPPLVAGGVEFQLFGSTHIPAAILAWMREGTGETLTTMLERLRETSAVEFGCEMDSMRHHNKGVMGLRLSHSHDVVLDNVRIANLANIGTRSAFDNAQANCAAVGNPYKGADSRGIVLNFAENVQSSALTIQTVSAQDGAVFGIDARVRVANVDVPTEGIDVGAGLNTGPVHTTMGLGACVSPPLEDCQEDLGVACAGEFVAATDGQCCSQCVLESEVGGIDSHGVSDEDPLYLRRLSPLGHSEATAVFV